MKGYPSVGVSHIIPLHCPGNHRSLKLAEEINRYGFSVKAIHSPTVPQGSERIRLSLSANHTPELLEELVNILPFYSQSDDH